MVCGSEGIEGNEVVFFRNPVSLKCYYWLGFDIPGMCLSLEGDSLHFTLGLTLDLLLRPRFWSEVVEKGDNVEREEEGDHFCDD